MSVITHEIVLDGRHVRSFEVEDSGEHWLPVSCEIYRFSKKLPNVRLLMQRADDAMLARTESGFEVRLNLYRRITHWSSESWDRTVGYAQSIPEALRMIAAEYDPSKGIEALKRI